MSNFYSLRISSLFFFYWCGLGLAAASSVPLSFSTYTATETELPASHADILNGPTGVKAVTALLDAIQLTWQPVAGASAYTLEVSARGAQGPFEPLVTLAGDRTSFRHSGLGSEQLLYYRVKAHGEGGESAYSAVVEGVSPGSVIRIMPLGDSN
ncbi:MAG: fibronectin type III domain-containing protein, partial [Hymenobacteraceae bacterium]|nr:fibronectin type III domain-containing protein [Hymenobacteraceae bacterium]